MQSLVAEAWRAWLRECQRSPCKRHSPNSRVCFGVCVALSGVLITASVLPSVLVRPTPSLQIACVLARVCSPLCCCSARVPMGHPGSMRCACMGLRVCVELGEISVVRQRCVRVGKWRCVLVERACAVNLNGSAVPVSVHQRVIWESVSVSVCGCDA